MKHLLLCDYDICYVRGKCRHCDQSMNQEMFNEEHVQLDEQNESVNRGTNLAFCRYCDQFMNNRIWHLYSFCIPNVTYEHLLKTPNVTYELLWTPNVTYELLSINTECDKWIEDASRLWHGYLIESNDHIWNGIPIVWMYEHHKYEHQTYEHQMYEHQLYEHLWTCILIVWMYEHLWTSIPCWFCCWIPTDMYTILMCWIPFDKYTMCYWIPFDKYTMWMLLKTFEAMYNVNDWIPMDMMTK